MSKEVITDSNKFEEIINNLEASLPNIKSIFDSQSANYERINETDAWSGKTQQIIYQKYRDLTKNYEPILNSLNNYVKFLKITIENYKNYETSLNSSIEDNEENLKAN